MGSRRVLHWFRVWGIICLAPPSTVNPTKLEHGLGGLMLGSTKLYLKDMRIVMFQYKRTSPDFSKA